MYPCERHKAKITKGRPIAKGKHPTLLRRISLVSLRRRSPLRTILLVAHLLQPVYGRAVEFLLYGYMAHGGGR